MEEKYPHLYHSFTPDSARYISHKKLALTLGIKASKHDWLVFTETNCMPASNQWLKLMARNFTSQTQIVLGYSGYDRIKGWLHKRIAFDTLFQSLRYLGFALAGNPYMGIGRNMAYRKELFFKQKGYSKYLNLQRGEDDLFINQIVTKTNTRVETDFNATMRIQPVYRYKDWKEEKISYMATARFYRGAQRYLSGFETFSRLLFYVACMAGIVFGILNFHWLVAGIALLIWLLRYITQAIVINRTAKEMGGGRKYYFSLPIFDILQPIQSLNFKLCRLFRGKGDFMIINLFIYIRKEDLLISHRVCRIDFCYQERRTDQHQHRRQQCTDINQKKKPDIERDRYCIDIITFRVEFENSELRLNKVECQTDHVSPKHSFSDKKNREPKKRLTNSEIVSSQRFQDSYHISTFNDNNQ